MLPPPTVLTLNLFSAKGVGMSLVRSYTVGDNLLHIEKPYRKSFPLGLVGHPKTKVDQCA